MSKRSEEAAKEIYKDGIELFGRRDKNGNLIIHPETMVGVLRNAAQRGYEQAEKDSLERVILWLKDNANKYIDGIGVEYGENGRIMELIVGGKCWDDLKKAMED